MSIYRWLWVFCWLASASPAFAERAVTIVNGGHSVVWTFTRLASRPDARALAIQSDVAYGTSLTYQVVPLRTLLQEQGFSALDTLQFVALDGFVASLPARLVLADGDVAQAWLAIEPENQPWPPLSVTNASTAGPFYLVWTAPEKSHIKQEQWPYQISRIERVDSLEKRFPVMAPPANTPPDSVIWSGFEVFKTQCSACHRMNGGGEGSVGPDLNRPMNPTRYFQPEALKKLIRNPAQVRTWNGSKMPAFAQAAISDVELDALIQYLAAMVVD